jgi:hypothetical protein
MRGGFLRDDVSSALVVIDRGQDGINVQDPRYGAKGNGVQLTDAVMTSSSGVLTSAHTFVAADVGKLIMVVGAGSVVSGVQGPLVTTIASVAAGVATLTATASTTTAAVGSSSTTISGAPGTGGALPTGTDSIPVASSAGYVAGNTVTLGTGGSAETFVVIGVPDSTHIDIEGSTAKAHTNGDTVAVGGTVAFICTDDTAAIQAAVDAAAVTGRKVLVPPGIYGLNATGINHASGVVIEGESRWSSKLVWFRSGSVPAQPGAIVVPPGTTKWGVRELDISGTHWSGGAWITTAAAGIMVQGGTSHGRIRGVRAHNTDNSGILVAIVSQSIATANNNYDISIDDCEAWGAGEDGIELNHGSPGVGMKTDRVAVRNCVAHHNFLDGLEIDGAASGSQAKHIVNGFTAYRNGASGLALDGAAGQESQRIVLSNLECYQNTTNGVTLNLCRYVSLTNVGCWDNTQNGIRFTAASDVVGRGLQCHLNLIRGMYVDTACSGLDIDIHAKGNGASSSAGQAAVEVDSSGGASSDINVRGYVTGNARDGLAMKSVTRGALHVVATGNGTAASSVGVTLTTCTEVTGTVNAAGNTTGGLKLATTCVNCAITAYLTPGASSAQTTGWSCPSTDCTGCVVDDVINTCSTPFSNSGPSPILRRVKSIQRTRGSIANADYTAKAHDSLIVYGSLSTAHQVTLPAASTVAVGQEMVIKDEAGTAGTNTITVAVASSGTIDGAASKTITTNYGSLKVYSNGTQWFTA